MQILLFRMSSFCFSVLSMPRTSDKNKKQKENIQRRQQQMEKNGPSVDLIRLDNAILADE